MAYDAEIRSKLVQARVNRRVRATYRDDLFDLSEKSFASTRRNRTVSEALDPELLTQHRCVWAGTSVRRERVGDHGVCDPTTTSAPFFVGKLLLHQSPHTRART